MPLVSNASRLALRQPGRALFSVRPTYKSCDPLRILFCGADEFSIASLKALHAEHVKSPEIIASIDVVCRPGKPVGRLRQEIRHLPIKSVAEELALSLHEIDTFKGWTPPTPQGEQINLIIAVSFGLFVPRRILSAAKYGGLNVHPSLLPDLKGPAPIHHALLAGDKTTGITLQTLDTNHFDEGLILDQTPAPGFPIPDPKNITVPLLCEYVAPKGAQMLIDGIRNRLFVPPLSPIIPRPSHQLRHARKIHPSDRNLDWSSWTWDTIHRRQKIIGPLWNNALSLPNLPKNPDKRLHRRIIYENLRLVEGIPGVTSLPEIGHGIPFALSGPLGARDVRSLYVITCDKKLVEIQRLKVEGSVMSRAFGASLKARFFNQNSPGKFVTFHEGLI
ncbi:Methionyl-tRNA formyltransferase [Myotisia sp. PD_48]|nr:Methionyl-tRNA formyltransferase [Myotisia sp. PD_48]